MPSTYICSSDRAAQETRGEKGLQQQPCGRDQRGHEALRGGHGRLTEGHIVATEVRAVISKTAQTWSGLSL